MPRTLLRELLEDGRDDLIFHISIRSNPYISLMV
jgi:hypothetical protein